jgi:hypothetical protein
MAGKKTEDEPTKAELQRQMKETRASISETVDEIKETVSHQYDVVKDTYETVKEGVGEVLDWREQFSKNPIVWGAGAVSLGILVGIGLAHSMGSVPASDRRRRKSKQGALNESLLSNLSGLSETLLPTMTSKIKEMFGIDINAYLPAPAAAERRPSRMIGARRPATTTKKKSAAKKSRARKSSAK